MKKKKKINIPVLAGSLIIGFFVVIAILAPCLVPCDPAATSALTYGKPSAEHWLGTNDVGQDIFSELIYGTRISMVIGVFAALVVTCVGTLLALLSAWYGGAVDKLITGLTNLAMAVPGLALTTLLVCYLSPGIFSIVIAISITAWTGDHPGTPGPDSGPEGGALCKNREGHRAEGQCNYGQAPFAEPEGHHPLPGGHGRILGHDDGGIPELFGPGCLW